MNSSLLLWWGYRLMAPDLRIRQAVSTQSSEPISAIDDPEPAVVLNCSICNVSRLVPEVGPGLPCSSQGGLRWLVSCSARVGNLMCCCGSQGPAARHQEPKFAPQLQHLVQGLLDCGSTAWDSHYKCRTQACADPVRDQRLHRPGTRVRVRPGPAHVQVSRQVKRA